MNIDKINNGLTIHKGCFNCTKRKTCRLDKLDLKEIHYGRNHIPYRAGCCCQDYESDKERVEFT